MSEGIFVATAPRLSINEDVATVVKWYVAEEGTVALGNPLCMLEVSKATYDVDAEATGYVVHLVDEGSEVRPNQPMALIGSTLETLRAERVRLVSKVRMERSPERSRHGQVRATRKAQEIAKRLGVDLTQVPVQRIIREQDVIQYREASRLDRRQVAVELSWDPARQPVAIYGAGRGAVTLKECLDFDEAYQVVCFIDDDSEHPDTLCQLPVYHSSRLNEIVEGGVRSLACEIADGAVRLRILRQCDDLSIDLINAIHPGAYVAPTVRMGAGNYIKAGAVVETTTVIGACCIIDNSAVVAHDNVIGDGCHIAPGVSTGSSIHVGELTIIGIGASIATGIRIGRLVIISVGTSVVKDVPDYAVIQGVPGRVVGKRKISG